MFFALFLIYRNITEINGISRGGYEDLDGICFCVYWAYLIMTDGIAAINGSSVRKDTEAFHALTLCNIFTNLHVSKLRFSL